MLYVLAAVLWRASQSLEYTLYRDTVYRQPYWAQSKVKSWKVEINFKNATSTNLYKSSLARKKSFH